MHISCSTIQRAARNSIEYSRQYIKTIIRSGVFKRNQHRAYIELEEVNVPRRLNQVCWLLRQAGYGILVRIGLRAFIGFNQIGKDSFHNPDTFLSPFKDSRGTLRVSDSDLLIGDGNTKILHVDYNFFPPETEKFKGNCYIPIMFHPSLMNEDTYAHAEGLAKNTDRKVLMLFAGSLSRDLYNRQIIRDHFGLNTRNEIIDAVEKQSESRDLLYKPRHFREFEERKDSGELRKKIVVIDTGVCRIPQERWLDILSEVAFFIAAPGISMPFCHNLPESMAVGAIPVIQFGDLLYPPLENRRNCFAFSDLDELKNVMMNLIPHLEQDEIREMRERVVQYHKDYLSPESFVLKMREFEQDSRQELRLFMARRIYND